MPCSSKSVQERSTSLSLLLNGGSFEEYDAELNEMVKEAERKSSKKKQKRKKAIRKNLEEQRRIKKKWQRGTGRRLRAFSATWEGFFWKWITYPFYSENLLMAMYWFVNVCFKEKFGLKEVVLRYLNRFYNQNIPVSKNTYYIETSQSTCIANQLICFYDTGLYWQEFLNALRLSYTFVT